ncbi:META domain-containing protein [Streptomyces sp. ISL-66]|uniref:META domain-containing protein n=1 Tax=Streptomyces sp. ISL-66 TaxID=2819186 RepID=UPI001BE6947B|nr:META domain-containing protein [Streptomyces sp. ISL-66]MBT2468689.1 META domain-containing protein [Streptomyces sp. ISL-66]
MRTLRHVALALALTAATTATAAACGDGSGPRGTYPGSGFSGSWSVQSLTVDGKTLTAPAAARLTVEPARKGHDGQATGNYGCNGFTAAVVFDTGSTMTVTPGSVTDMACADLPFETAFGKLFRGRLTVEGGAQEVTLKTPDGNAIALTSEPRTPDAPLIATAWTVNSLVDGGTTASVPAGAEGAARFTVGADGSASGSLGCNRFNAKATVDGDSLTFGPLATTRMACEGAVGDLERTLTDLFGSGTLRWKIHGDALDLTATTGKGLTATAASAVE